eukprot:9908438-Heterocapsa_arctica.AAC.1
MQAQFAHSRMLFMLPGLSAPARRHCCCSWPPAWIAFDAPARLKRLAPGKGAARRPARQLGQAGQAGDTGGVRQSAAGQRRQKGFGHAARYLLLDTFSLS